MHMIIHRMTPLPTCFLLSSQKVPSGTFTQGLLKTPNCHCPKESHTAHIPEEKHSPSQRASGHVPCVPVRLQDARSLGWVSLCTQDPCGSPPRHPVVCGPAARDGRQPAWPAVCSSQYQSL